MSYVIRCDLEPKSYYCRTSRVGPLFGPSLDGAALFDSRQEAGAVVASWPSALASASVVVDLDDVQSAESS